MVKQQMNFCKIFNRSLVYTLSTALFSLTLLHAEQAVSESNPVRGIDFFRSLNTEEKTSSEINTEKAVPEIKFPEVPAVDEKAISEQHAETAVQEIKVSEIPKTEEKVIPEQHTEMTTQEIKTSSTQKTEEKVAPEQYAGNTLKEIKISGNQRIESETILSHMPIKVNGTFDHFSIDQSLKDLFATGYFTDVQVTQEGLHTLLVKVQENPIINRIAFEGNKKIKDDKLKEEVQLRPREALSRTKIQSAQHRILEIYRRMGRFGAKVDPKLIKLPENRVDLVFEIKEGAVTYIRKINFIGNKHINSKKLESHLLTKRARWYRFFASDDVYDPDRFTADQQALRQFYYDNGYPDFRIISAIAELSTDQKDFYLTFTLDEGKMYQFGKINIISHIPNMDIEKLKSLVVFKESETFSGKLIEKTVNAITDAVGSQGYAFTDIHPNIEKNSKTNTVDVTFEINQGPRVYIEKIEINGNDRTHDEVIRRELAIHEGDAYNASKLKKSEKNLKNLDYFKTATVTAEQGSAPDLAKLIVKVEEQPTGELGLAGGYSTMDGPLGNIRIIERNFRGKGQIVHSDFTIAKKRQDFDIGFIEPHFLDRKLAAGVDLFRVRSTRFNAYTQTSKGTSLSLGYHLTEPLTQQLVYTIRDDRVGHVSSLASRFIKEQAGTTITSSIGQTLSYDQRDSRIDPTAGYILSLSNAYAGVGGSVNYLKNSIGGNWYYSPFEDIVLGIKGAIGNVMKVKKVVRVVDSIMLGGETLRGFEYGGLGPRDSTSGDSLGGTRFWSTTAEVVFPIGLPNEFGVKGAVFTDVGTVWKPGSQGPEVLDRESVRAAVGFGISWSSPFGPLRIDYAVPIKKEKFDRTQRLLLGFSTRF